jgi:hypothetical protein
METILKGVKVLNSVSAVIDPADPPITTILNLNAII